MILHGLGVELLVRMMGLDRSGDDEAWLLFGPTDDRVVQPAGPKPAEDTQDTIRWAAE